jgi:SHS2 domain-containing protein
MTSAERGHRVLGHTADVVLEAWGPDLASCCEEAVAALVATYTLVQNVTVVGQHPVRLAAGPPDRQVLQLLDEVVFLLDTADQVPVGALVVEADDGELEAHLLLADVAMLEPSGSVPKAIARTGPVVTAGRSAVRCRVLVDV